MDREHDIPPPTARELDEWGAAATHEAFGALTAAWLLGAGQYYPAYAAASPADETAPLLSDLARLNRVGFVTDGSQPGVPFDSKGSAQRAYVTGYCSESTAEKICSGLRSSDLVIMSFSPGSLGDGSIVVTLDEGIEYTWLGRRPDPGELLELYTDRAGPRLGALVESSWELQVFDPQWGRNDVLLPSLLRVLDDANASAGRTDERA